MKKIILLFLVCFGLKATAQTLTNAQVYDYLPGDVFQWTHVDIDDMNAWETCWVPYTYSYHTDSIISKYYSAASDTVFYSVYSTAYTPVQCNPTLPPLFVSGTSTKYYTSLSAPAYDTTGSAMSCSHVADSFYVSPDYCGRNVWELHSYENTTCFEAPAWSVKFVEGCGSYANYRGGYGGEPHYTNTLTYYKKGGVPCGVFSTVGIAEEKIEETTFMYPNPSTGNFTVQCDRHVIQTVTVKDPLGRVVKVTRNVNSPSAEISLEKENKGCYFVEIIYEGQIRPVFKKIIIE